jgi:hypothetical protein
MSKTIPGRFSIGERARRTIGRHRWWFRSHHWTGFYAGGNVGGAWTSNDALWSPVPSSAAFGAFPIAGDTGGSSVVGGLQAG